MDGFDTSGFEVGRVYVVDDRLGRYLATSGYAALFTPNERTETGISMTARLGPAIGRRGDLAPS
jgi:hypothetical protein